VDLALVFLANVPHQAVIRRRPGSFSRHVDVIAGRQWLRLSVQRRRETAAPAEGGAVLGLDAIAIQLTPVTEWN